MEHLTSPTPDKIEPLHKLLIAGDDAAGLEVDKLAAEMQGLDARGSHLDFGCGHCNYSYIDLHDYCTRYRTDATSALSLKWPPEYDRTIYIDDDRIGDVEVHGPTTSLIFHTPSLATNLTLACMWARAHYNQRNGESK